MPSEKPFLDTLRGQVLPVPPIWLMRQAGRYLPEYRELRARAGSFQAMIRDPELATEVTLQPLRRFNFDAAILFSDILVIPAALGQVVTFEDGRGPVLGDLPPVERLEPGAIHDHLQPVYETLSRLRKALPDEGFDRTALIGFAGAPWTIACYMIEGGGSKEFARTRSLAYGDPEAFGRLIDIVTDATASYLIRQIEAGAEAVQIFDSWAGILPADQFERWVMAPTRKITTAIKAAYPGIPVIGFARGGFYPSYAQSGIDALGLDERVAPEIAAGFQLPVQGNLDPFVLRAGGEALDDATDRIMAGLQGKPYVFNLGHGVNKDTPPEHVMRLVNRVRMTERM